MYIILMAFRGTWGIDRAEHALGRFDACLMAPFPLLHKHGGVVRPNIPIVEEQD